MAPARTVLQLPEAEPPSPPTPAPPSSAGASWLPLGSKAPRAAVLTEGLHSPMPGGLLSGYSADTGLDIAGFKMAVHAIAAGTIDYAEGGHSRWQSRGDSPYTIRITLDVPITWKKGHITHAYYGHLSVLDVTQPEGRKPPFHVEGGERLGLSGWANGSPHLHLGLLLDGHVDQDDWAFILSEEEVRIVLGRLANGHRLPR